MWHSPIEVGTEGLWKLWIKRQNERCKQEPIAIVVLFGTGPRRFLYRNTFGRLTSEEVCDTTGGLAERFFIYFLWFLELTGY